MRIVFDFVIETLYHRVEFIFSHFVHGFTKQVDKLELSIKRVSLI